MLLGNLLYTLATGYLWCGLAVAVAFLAFGLDRVHPVAHGSHAFRPLLIPGLTLLWPLVVVKWWLGDSAGKES